MGVTSDDANDRIERIEALLEELRIETAASREEARVISESMATHARLVKGIGAFQRRSAEVREASSRAKTRTR